MPFRLTLILGLFLICASVQAEQFRLGVPSMDVGYFDAQIAVLNIALDHARGEHTLETVVYDTPALRAIRDFEAGSADFDMFIAGYDPDKEKRFRQLYVPLTQGLLGMRIFAIKQGKQTLFDRLKNLKQLTQTISVTSANLWTDTRILQAAGFTVQTAEVENLWNLLANDRVDAFPRAAHEIEAEIRDYEHRVGPSDIVAEESLLLMYPFDYFLYLRDADTTRQIILQTGFTNAYRSGALEKHFQAQLAALEKSGKINLKDRTVIQVPYEDVSLSMKKIPDHYWLQLD